MVAQDLGGGVSALVSKNDIATRRNQKMEKSQKQQQIFQSPFLISTMLVLAMMHLPGSAAFQPTLRVPFQLQMKTLLWQKDSRSTFLHPSAPRRSTNSYSKLCMAPSSTTSDDIDLNSNDPFVILGLDPKVDGMDKKTIKRAYKRRALRYHPDVVCNPNSTDEERRTASDQFAKINAAYETLSGKGSGGSANGAASSSSRSSGSTSAGGGWTPPHRRSPGEAGRSYSSTDNNNNGGTSWEDFMPKYDDADYDAGGDSFGSIFADLVAGAAGAAAGYSSGGSGSIMTDFVEFLEQNLDGYSSGSSGSGGRSSDKAELDLLLRTGSVDEIGEEMDDTELVVQQLNSKCQSLENERMSLQAELANAQRFSETMDLEERMDECNARKKVVDKYLTQARKRLLALQTRYKELIMGGRNDSKAGGRSSSRRSSTGASSSSSSSSSTNTSENTGGTTGRESSRTTSSNPEDAWKTDSFGSSGRSRGSGRRRSSRSRTRGANTEAGPSTASSPSSSSYSSPSSSPASASGGASRRSTESTQSTVPATTSQSPSSGDNSYVPPHRRSGASNQARDDTQRLRDLKVDDEFEKLKREMGL